MSNAFNLDPKLLLEALVDHTSFFIYWKDTDLNYLGCNRAFAEFAGVSRVAEIIGLSDSDLPWNAEETAQSQQDDLRILSDGEPLLDMVKTHELTDGHAIAIRSSKLPIHNPNGDVIGIVGYFEDITEQTQVVEDLEQSNQRFRQAIELASLGYCLTDAIQDETIFCSQEYAQLHGRSVKEFVENASSTELSFVHVDDRDRMRVAITELRRGKRLDEMYRVLWPNGEVRHVREIAEPVFDDDGRVVQEFWTIHDISAKIEAEERLHRAQRLEGIGKLTGGVAHDFNNLLAVILGSLELIEDDNKNPEIQTFIHAAIEATLRGANLTKNMLSFARQAPLEPTNVDLNKVVRRLTEWGARILPASIDVEILLQGDLREINADPSSTESALLNLIVNARDAMPDGGKLTIQTKNVQLSSDDCVALDGDLSPGLFVMMSVSDTGEGISREEIRNIFDPFYTTKQPGEGSGLGLSMIQGFMKQSGGAVRVESAVNQGTVFNLYFAVTTKEAMDSVDQEIVVLKRSANRARILVAEDERGLMQVITTALERSGYTIIQAKTGDEALRLFDEQGPFDLLMTDMVMPGQIQGGELARKLQAKHPRLPVVFMTGYSEENSEILEGRRPEEIQLQKPVSRTDLIQAIEAALESNEGR